MKRKPKAEPQSQPETSTPVPTGKPDTVESLKRQLKASTEKLLKAEGRVRELTQGLEPIKLLEKDLIEASRTLGRDEVRYLIGAYYSGQKSRISSHNQVVALYKDAKPHDLLAWNSTQYNLIEDQLKRALRPWCLSQPICRWSMGICGIDVILSAGLAAHLDTTDVRTAQRLWRFAGLDPGQQWLGADAAHKTLKEFIDKGYSLDDSIPLMANVIGTRVETLTRLATTKRQDDGTFTPCKLTVETLAKASAKRPWNASLKTLCYKLGESFVKVSGNPSDFYGRYYKLFKNEDIVKNEAGKLSGEAAKKLAKFRIGKGTEAYKWYSQGKLPPAHIHARARRRAVKLFLSHYQEVAWRLTHDASDPPPAPYPIGVLGHTDYIPPPNWPMEGD